MKGKNSASLKGTITRNSFSIRHIDRERMKKISIRNRFFGRKGHIQHREGESLLKSRSKSPEKASASLASKLSKQRPAMDGTPTFLKKSQATGGEQILIKRPLPKFQTKWNTAMPGKSCFIRVRLELIK